MNDVRLMKPLANYTVADFVKTAVAERSRSQSQSQSQFYGKP